jgi:hypothetical protein
MEKSSCFAMMSPNNSPEPPPIALLVPHSRLTGWAARLSFGRWLHSHSSKKE